MLALAALSFVLYPLLANDPSALTESDSGSQSPEGPGRIDAIDALREIEFDRATGKLSDSDYVALKATYTQRAVSAMRSADSPVWPRCGPRPEKGARYCSNCGAAMQA